MIIPAAVISLGIIAGSTSAVGASLEQAAPPPSNSLDQWAGGEVKDDSLHATARRSTGGAQPVGSSPGSSGGAQRPVDCLVADAPGDSTTATPGLAGLVEPAASLVAGERYYQECWYTDTGDIFYAGFFVYEPGVSGPNAYALAQVAYGRAPLVPPEPRMAPGVDQPHLVGLATWLWVDPSYWEPISARAEVTGLSVEAVAVPSRLVWDMGDGHSVTCHGPGTPWRPGASEPGSSDCSHTFQYVSARQPDGRYHGSVTIEWDVSWRASNGESGSLGVARRSTPFALTVGERQAVVCTGEIDHCTAT